MKHVKALTRAAAPKTAQFDQLTKFFDLAKGLAEEMIAIGVPLAVLKLFSTKAI